MCKSTKVHNLNGYFHNVIALLKYLKEDAVIKNEETIEMLDLALSKEMEVLRNLKSLTENSEDQ